ncbi:MAG TPA: hypothetical protein VGL13_07870, partial [Polyangiaceae bacterium]
MARRPSKKTERRTTLTAMAQATQRTSEMQRAPGRGKELRTSVPPPPAYDRLPTRDELPPPYDDASGFIDLDKLREAAMAEAAFPVPPVPQFTPYQTSTAPPVEANIPEMADDPPRRLSATTGILIGGAIAVAGLAASFFIVSRGLNVPGVRGPQAAMAIKAESREPKAAAPAPVAAQPAAPTAAAPAAQAPAQQAAAGSTEESAAPSTGATRDFGDLDSGDRGDAKSRARMRSRARRSKSLRAEKAEAVAAGATDTTPDPALAQALQKSAEPTAPAAAPEPEPALAAKAAPPPALPAGPPGLAAAIQKASGVTAADVAPAPRPAPAPAAPPPVAGLPDAPSLGAVR